MDNKLDNNSNPLKDKTKKYTIEIGNIENIEKKKDNKANTNDTNELLCDIFKIIIIGIFILTGAILSYIFNKTQCEYPKEYNNVFVCNILMGIFGMMPLYLLRIKKYNNNIFLLIISCLFLICYCLSFIFIIIYPSCESIIGKWIIGMFFSVFGFSISIFTLYIHLKEKYCE